MHIAVVGTIVRNEGFCTKIRMFFLKKLNLSTVNTVKQ